MSNLWPEKDDSPAGKGGNTAKRTNFKKFRENYPEKWDTSYRDNDDKQKDDE